MPHFIAKSLENIEKGVEFVAKSKDIDLLGVRAGSREFLLSLRKKKENYLVKYEKITRISDKELVKEALREFAINSKAKVIQSNFEPKNSLYSEGEFERDIDFFIDKFRPEREVWIEIGFGTGRHLLHMAKQNPNIEFIGVEIYRPSIDTLSKHLKLERVSNVHIINYDARVFMEFLASNSVGRVFVHFPVPWDKKPHRRVFSRAFVDEVIRVLKPTGTLELRTDSQNYFNYSLNLFLEYREVEFEVKKNRDLEISSKYEDRWKRKSKDIYDLTLKNLKTSKELELSRDFSFEKVEFNRVLKNFKRVIFRDNDYILHLENIYSIDESSGLLRVTLGSFDRVESRYIEFRDEKIKYYQKEPIPSRANLKAHKRLKEYFKWL